MDKTFTMMVGLPGAGKSTIAAERFQDNDKTVIVSSDGYIERYAAEKGISYSQAYDEYLTEANARCMQDARGAFATGKNVVWDQTNLTLEERAHKLAIVPEDYFKAAIVIQLSTDELTDRFVGRYHETGKFVDPKHMDAMAEDYKRPGRYEGFDFVDILTE